MAVNLAREAAMRFGVVFPQTEIGADPAVVKDYAQAAEALGYTHLLVFDHVLGADPNRPEGWRGPYTHQHQLHEPMVLFGYLAGLTQRLELVTGVIILPQRQTALVAKQAAEVDVLSGGRLRLGVGVGWNAVEYEALNEDFHTRGRREVEQIEVMRRLWTEPLVDYHGRTLTIPRAGIAPLPVQRPIPVWLGGMADAVLRRVARHADGWFPQFRPGTDTARTMMETLRGYAQDAGREMADIGIEGRFAFGAGNPDEWRQSMEEWRAIGATHVSVNTMGAGLASPRDHIDAIRRVKEAL
jgi:probable F420-dependent oxidoreductase